MASVRSGRRPGNSGSRERILEAARERFAEYGFDRTSIRSIAADAEVDAALVHHYFGSKQKLFASAIKLPADPAEVLAPIAAAPLSELGATFLRTILGVWDSPAGAAGIAVFRSAIAGQGTELVRSFLIEVALKGLTARVDEPAGSGLLRANLAASQMSGIILTRYILRLEPLASMPAEEIVTLVSPTLQRYFTGPIEVPTAKRSARSGSRR